VQSFIVRSMSFLDANPALMLCRCILQMDFIPSTPSKHRDAGSHVLCEKPMATSVDDGGRDETTLSRQVLKVTCSRRAIAENLI
jgi:hypothetical protein